MKHILNLLAVLMLALLIGTPVFAQQPTPIQHTALHADAAKQISTSATSAATISLTPNGGDFVTVYSISITNCAGSSAVTAAAVTTLSTTNITGTPAWTIGSGVAAGLCQPVIQEIFPTGLRSTVAGTPVTLVLPTFATNQTLRVNVSWSSTPAPNQ